MPRSGIHEPGPSGAGWHQDPRQCQQAPGEKPSADVLARRASAKQWSDKARQREQLAEAAEQEETEAECSGDPKASKRAARRAGGARKRADDGQKLAIEKAESAGLLLVTMAATDALKMPLRALRADAAGHPMPSAHRNVTDPDSHFLKGSDGWIQGYNCQAAVDGDHQVIVAIGVSNQPSDAVHLLPKLERIQANTGQQPGALIADAGYCSTTNLEACEQPGLQAYISLSREQHGRKPRPSRGRAPKGLDARGRMDRKLRSKAGPAVYALRKTIVEPVFGQIKGSRRLDRFRLRGLEKVNGEWSMIATTPNIL